MNLETLIEKLKFLERHFGGKVPVNIFDTENQEWKPLTKCNYRLNDRTVNLDILSSADDFQFLSKELK